MHLFKAWSQPPVEGSPPSNREGAAMIIHGSQLVLFGGRGDHQRYNDIYFLDLNVHVASFFPLQFTSASKVLRKDLTCMI